MGSGLKAQNMTGIRAQNNGIRDQKAFEPESGIRFITRSKNLLSQYFSALIIRFVSTVFPGRGTLLILASGWRQFLSYEVLVVWRKHGIMFLSYFIVEGTVIWISSHFSRFVTHLLNALSNARRQRKRFIHIFFCEKWGRRKRTKRNPVTEKGT